MNASVVTRLGNNTLKGAFSWSGMREHYALQPLAALMIMTLAGVAAYILRMAVFYPDYNFGKKHDPYNYYRERQQKFINMGGVDYKEAGKRIPDLERLDEWEGGEAVAGEESEGQMKDGEEGEGQDE